MYSQEEGSDQWLRQALGLCCDRGLAGQQQACTAQGMVPISVGLGGGCGHRHLSRFLQANNLSLEVQNEGVQK